MTQWNAEEDKYRFTTEDLARHSRNQKIHLNHEKHEKSRKKPIQFYHRGRRAHGGNTNTLHHEGHEVNEVNPGSAGRLSGFIHFAFGDQRLAVGSRPAGRRWRVRGNNYLFAGETRTVPGSPSRPSSRTFN